MAGMGRHRTVAVAMDGSHFSAYAFEWYMHHIHHKNDEVVLIHCPEYHRMFSQCSSEPGQLNSMCADVDQRTRELVAGLEQRLKDAGVNGRVRCENGEPGHVIVKLAEEAEAKMIITGCRGQSTIRRTLMGSVSDYVIHHAHVPVVVCRHTEHYDLHGHKHTRHHFH